MALPGARNWWEMTGGEIEDMNRNRCADLPFGGRGDATCAQFGIENLGFGKQVVAPDTDENRTSEAKIYDFKIWDPLGLYRKGADAVKGKVDDAAKGIGSFGSNVVLIGVGVVLIIGGLFLWSARNQGHSIGQALASVNRGGN